MDWNSRFLNVGQQSQLADRSNSQSPSQTDGFSFSNELAKATDSILNRAVTHSMNPVLQRLDEFRTEFNQFRTEFNQFRTEVNRRFDEVNQNISEFARAVDQRFASLTASRGPDFITRLAYPNAK
jgi:methyl-accepting chemotaxis protein